MKEITEYRDPSKSRKKRKKSFWFEFAEDKGVNPHKSAWSDFLTNEKENDQHKRGNRFCSRCGVSLQLDAKFCERCGQRVRSN
ncbi:MAG: zinc-ribbon domain-containing protein [Candidatus Hodarchaeota archaeon]